MTIDTCNMFKTNSLTIWLAALVAGLMGSECLVFGAAQKSLPGHVPGVVASLVSDGRLTATNQLNLAIGLPLRNEAELDDFLSQLSDPGSPNYRKYLTPQEFTARFGPTEADYALVRQFAETNGFKVIGTHDNRLVLDVQACSADIERAFHVTLRTYPHPTEGRKFFAPDQEPSVPDTLPVADMWGLSDYGRPKPLGHKLDPLKVRPLGGSVSGYYAGDDFRNAYVPGTTLDGSGQSVGLLQFSDFYLVDITNYQNTIGRTSYVPVKTVVLPGGTPDTANNVEVALDIEMVIAMAPALTQVIVYEIKSVNPSSILSRMATDNLAKQLSSSWAWSGGPSTTVTSAFKQMASQGQSFFQASGDDDAYTGAQILDNASQVNSPIGSTNITTVGGTTLGMNGAGDSWSSEQVWNYHGYGGAYANEGSGGGISSYYKIPYWQTALSTNVSLGSSVWRNVPDVALTADQVYVAYDNGSSGGMAGTSCAAPLWAGFCALANQFAVATNGTTLGFLNPALYAIAGSGRYADCFHDITTGNNVGTNTAGLYNAVAGYDLCTGLGTPNGTNLISALVWPPPLLLTQPVSRNVTNGTSLTLSATASGTVSYGWLFNGTKLTDGGNLSGTAGNVLTITAATTNNSGNYRLTVSNLNGVVTSSVAILNVGFAPVVATPLVSQTNLTGNTVAFAATVSGSTPLSYQWRKSGTNLANGTGIDGATSNLLTLSAITSASAGSYSLYATNIFGVVTSSVAALTVVLPAAITGASLTNRTVECGRNTNAFALAATGTTPLSIQWSLDGVPVAGATSTNFAVTNLSLPSHTVTVTATNLYSSVTSNLVVTVQDTLAPVVTLNGSNPVYIELGGGFTDPGATAADACAGTLAPVVSGSVNPAVLGTNTLSYSATDGNGNTAVVTRTVIVRDTTPPAITWSFASLVLAADTNCGAMMPDVTGAGYVLATDLSGAVSISQQPTNHAVLPLGTNRVVITVQDASGNAAASTNVIIVQEQTPPQLLASPASATNFVGDTVVFSAAASACSPLTWQWFFNATELSAQTNSTLTLADLSLAAAGDYYVVVNAAGGASTSAVATLTLTLRPATLAFTSSANPAGFKDALSFAAAVTPASATGTLQVLTNGSVFTLQTLLPDATASIPLDVLPRGTNVVTAIYSGDGEYLPATNSLAQIITNHPPVALPLTVTNSDTGTLNLALVDLATNWSDADGDAVSLTAVGVSTNGITVANDGTTLTYSNANAVADQFTCMLSDGWGGTNVQTVTIAPALVLTPLITGVAATGDGHLTLNLGGAPGYTYILESTTNLVLPASWLPMETNTLGTNGVWQFTDPQAPILLQRFYRLELLR